MKEVLVFGHRNPDTDSICSAIAYTYLKNKITDSDSHISCRIGEISNETKYVLEKFNLEEPKFIEDVKTQIKDIPLKSIPVVHPGISLKKAWSIMKKYKNTTLPTSFDGNSLDGIITVGDIANSLMDIYESTVLSEAKTTYRNIIEVLDAEMVVGNIDDSVYNGKVIVGAMNPETMEAFIQPKDIVILGNRLEAQLMAIEKKAQCLIITGGSKVSDSIKKIAAAANCAILVSPHDTYHVARFVNQSIPVSHYMKTRDLFYFEMDDYIDDIRSIMVQKRYRNFPVLDENKRFVGILSRAMLIDLSKKKVILVDHNEKSQSVNGLEEAEILEIIDHHRIGDIETVGPVFFRNQPLGCTATIVANMFKENDIEIPKNIAGGLCAAILSDTLVFKSPTCTPIDINTAEKLAALADVNIIELSRQMFRAGSNLRGMAAEDIFYQDFKRFASAEKRIGVGQISSLDRSDLDDIKIVLKPFMKKVKESERLDYLLFMFTDIINAETELVFYGNCKEVLQKAFKISIDGDTDSVMLKGIVSRKKQVIPPILMNMER